MKEETKKDILVAVIAGACGIIAGFAGGVAVTNNNTNTNEPNISISVGGSTSTVTVEEIPQIISDQSTEIQYYKDLYETQQSEKKSLSDTNADLLAKNEKLIEEKSSLANDIAKLTIEKDLLNEQYNSLLAEMENLKATTSLSSVPVDESSQNSLENDTISSGDYILLSDMDYLFESDGRYKTFDMEKDNYGEIHYDVICGGLDRTYFIDKKFSTIEGTFFHIYENRSYDMYGSFSIYGDGSLLYHQEELEVGWKPIEFSIDISNVENLQIVLHADNGGFGIGYFAALSDVKLYRKK